LIVECCYWIADQEKNCKLYYYEHVYSLESRRDRQAGRQTDRQTDRQTNKQTMTTQSYNIKEITCAIEMYRRHGRIGNREEISEILLSGDGYLVPVLALVLGIIVLVPM